MPTSYFATIRRESAVVCYWRLNDAAVSTRALDWANKFTLNGLYNKISVLSPPLIYNEFGGSRKFGETEKNLEIPDAEPLRVIGDIALEAWILPLAATQTAALIGKMNTAYTFPEPYYLGLSSGKVKFGLGNGTTEKSVTTSVALRPGGPSYHVTAFADTHFEGGENKTTMTVVINGVESASTIFSTASQEIKDGGKPIFVGALGNNTSRFNGMMAEVALYNDSLSVSRALRHFNIGRGVLPEAARYTTFDPPMYS